MKIQTKYLSFSFIVGMALCSSCSVIEKSSRHGFDSGYYKMKTPTDSVKRVYLDVNDNGVAVYSNVENGSGNQILTVSLAAADSLLHYPIQFTKTSIDIDITTIPLKVRPSVDQIPVQVDVNLNFALYAGWRHDNYYIRSTEDPLKKSSISVDGRGYDFGFLAGMGSTNITPFTTNDLVINEYNGMILQFGLAGFLESKVASFGVATGFDYLLSSDRTVWIYNKKPWIGFIIGIALN